MNSVHIGSLSVQPNGAVFILRCNTTFAVSLKYSVYAAYDSMASDISQQDSSSMKMVKRRKKRTIHGPKSHLNCAAAVILTCMAKG